MRASYPVPEIHSTASFSAAVPGGTAAIPSVVSRSSQGQRRILAERRLSARTPFQPSAAHRICFDPKGDGKMAIRGGYGIFYEHTNGNEGNTESLEGSAPLVLTAATSPDIIG